MDRFFETDHAQFGFQGGLNILQAVLEVEGTRRNGACYFAILDLKKAYDKVIRLILKQKLDKILPTDIVKQLIVFLVVVEMITEGDYTATKAKAKTGLNQGGAISLAFHRVFINELPARIRNRHTEYTLEPMQFVYPVADDVIIVAKLGKAMQSRLDECSDWADEDEAEWTPDKCIMMCMESSDLKNRTFRLAGKPVRNTTSGEYLGINFTQRGFEEKALQASLQKGRGGIRELNENAWFNAGLPPAATRSLYQTYVMSRIIHGVIVWRSGDATCRADRQLLSDFSKALFHIRTSLSKKHTERLCLLYGITTLEDKLTKQSTTFVKRLTMVSTEGQTENIKKHAHRSLKALHVIEAGIVCGRLRLGRDETWEQRLER